MFFSLLDALIEADISFESLISSGLVFAICTVVYFCSPSIVLNSVSLLLERRVLLLQALILVHRTTQLSVLIRDLDQEHERAQQDYAYSNAREHEENEGKR